MTLQVGRAGSVGSSLPLSVVVSDTGIGFAPGDGDLYQRFHQLDGSMTRKYGGLGIGLAICRQLVDLLGGVLSHESQPQQCTVLIVEDNAINQLVTRGMLLKLGYRVRTADNGAEALELLRSETVDAVLLDCQMPVMDGFATCRALRALPGCAELPVLAITAHSHSGDRERCLAAGMSDYLAKPVKFDELRVLLHDWVLCRPATVSGGAAPV